jgi:hypothetical protein
VPALTGQAWHRYRLTMNNTEVEQHRKESGEPELLVTIKVECPSSLSRS